MTASMPGRFGSLDAFRDAVARLGFPVTEDELQRLWELVTDLHAQADGLRTFLTERLGTSPLSSRGDGSDVR